MDENIKELNKKFAVLNTELKRQKTLITKLENDNKKISDQNKYLNEHIKVIEQTLRDIRQELLTIKNANINIKNKDKVQDNDLISLKKRIENLEDILGK